ncbi:MAG: hypothetical protein IH874_00110 [Candidatus Dadabacteria bacterium]|nr:hypothetical protein [Candidatus Dadabacteria bacterium]
MANNKKKCFVICQIGEDNSEERQHTDDVMEYIIKPATDECGYDAKRSIDLKLPTTITNEIIIELMEAPLVIADISGRNPNVFYELAIRHFANKATIQIKNKSEDIPFDINDQSTIDLWIAL